MAFRPVFKRERDGRVLVSLERSELDLLSQLASQLRGLLDAPSPDDAAIDRLFPRAYLDPTEEEAEEVWQAIAGSDLLARRIEALRTLVEDVEATGSDESTKRVRFYLDRESEAAWLGVLNDLRLTLGSRLGITEDEEVGGRAQSADTTALAVYDWLTQIQGALVDLALDEMSPEGGAPESEP